MVKVTGSVTMGRTLPGLVPFTASPEGSPASLLSPPLLSGALASALDDSGAEEELSSPSPQAANTVATMARHSSSAKSFFMMILLQSVVFVFPTWKMGGRSGRAGREPP